MNILVLDRFDVFEEPLIATIYDSEYSHNGYRGRDAYKLANLMLHSSHLLGRADVVLYISFNEKNARNFNYKILYSCFNSINLIKDLSNIFERYAYLYDLSLKTNTKCVTFDFKSFVTDELQKLSHEHNYYLIKSLRTKIRQYVNKKIFSNLNYKFYFIIMEAWEKFWMAVLGAVIFVVIVIFLKLTLSDKVTIRYELGSNHNIEKIIDNGADQSVMDITNMPPELVVKLIDSLNSTLKKYPDPRK